MSAARSMGLGAAASVLIGMFGIPVLAPLGLVVAGITHALANNEKNGRHDDDTEDDDATEAPTEPDDLPGYLPSLHEYTTSATPLPWELPGIHESYELPQFTVRQPRHQERPVWMNDLADMSHSTDADSEDDGPLGYDDEPSMRNERYFERQG